MHVYAMFKTTKFKSKYLISKRRQDQTPETLNLIFVTWETVQISVSPTYKLIFYFGKFNLRKEQRVGFRYHLVTTTS